jgi:GNAT superfamily N-acetyltransferase
LIQVAQLEEALPPPKFAALREQALREGYDHIERLAATWSTSLSGESAFFAAFRRDEAIGIGGLTPDPYEPSLDLLRMRFYVLPEFRRTGAGRMLAEAAFAWEGRERVGFRSVRRIAEPLRSGRRSASRPTSDRTVPM